MHGHLTDKQAAGIQSGNDLRKESSIHVIKQDDQIEVCTLKVVLCGSTWPAAHWSNQNCTPTGVRMILPASYSATCQHFDQVGQAFSSYAPMAALVTALKTYGAIFADFGGNGYPTADADPNWAGCNASGCLTTDYNTRSEQRGGG